MADAEDIEDIEDEASGTDQAEDTPETATDWLEQIALGEKALRDWQEIADALDLWYASVTRLASVEREREMQLFWANIQIIGPSIYSRPPIPVVVPAFKDKRQLNRTASEMLERVTVTGFRVEDIDAIMRLVRDDLTIVGRGVVWVRYEAENGKQKACPEYVHRKDFVHDPARNWQEVGWVAKRSWLTEGEAEDRFKGISGDEYKHAAYAVRKDNANNDITDGRLKAGFWEIWSKTENKVVWIAEGCDKILDQGPPHIEFENFFPCPRPAYGTVERSTLKPAPDMVMYKDQLEEVNQLTGRIGALTESLRLKGFYPAGAGEIGDAIEAAVKDQVNNAVLIGISNWAALGGAAAKDVILWLPLDMVATTLTTLIELRKQLIDDIYQITGLSDIMRGDTDADETLGAQQLKSQYGSIRVHDKQQELVRLARDITRLTAEVVCENFTAKTLLAMSQMEVPTDAEIAKQVKPLQVKFEQGIAAAKQALANPQTQELAKSNPDQAKQAAEQAQQALAGLQQQIEKLTQTVTIEQVVKFLRDNRARPFTMDIETDSTIAPDEAREQKQASEFLTAVGGYMAEAVPMVEQVPQLAPVVSAILKFVASKFRIGREIEGTIDEFADQMVQIGQQPKGPTPAMQKAQADAAAAQAQQQIDGQKLQLAAQKQQSDIERATSELALKQQLAAAANQIAADKLEIERGKLALETQKATDATKLASLQLILDKQAAVSADRQATEANRTLLLKHHSIEETKNSNAALDALVDIETTQIKVGADNDGANLDRQLEAQAGIAQQEHEKSLQATQIAADHAAQESAQASAETVAASQSTPTGPAS